MAELSPRARVVAEARSWRGTPFRHQARVKGVGVDCAQLVRAVGEAAGVLTIDPLLWQRFKTYDRQPDPTRMRDALATFLVPVTGEPEDGDIGWFAWRTELPMHLAIMASHLGRRTMIHALSDAVHRHDPATGVAQGKVVEHGYVAEWVGRLHLPAPWWRYPGIA